jgi:hypothetical protein
MRVATQSKWVSVCGALALLVMVGCEGAPAPTTSARKTPDYPQSSKSVVADPMHPPQDTATITSTYEDKHFGKTQVRSDNYLRHADSESPTGWTPWHYRSAPHNWGEPLTYEETVSGSVTARVKAVDAANRKITLQGPSGVSEKFIVGPQVQRLNEVHVGDNLTLAYTATLFGELRPATAEEAANPIMYYSYINRGSSDADPTGAEGTALRVVTTVDAIDVPGMTVTLRGPLGNKLAVRARSAENIRKISVGDTIVARYSQGVALALTKNP